MNLILTFICIILCFSAVLVMGKLFKKEGLMIWMSIASIIANILVCKNINIGGICFTLGNILFASNFLATDILIENYGEKYSKKSIYMSLCSVVIFIVSTQLGLLFIPDSTDIAHDSMKLLFSLNLRTCISSITMFFLGNLANVYVYQKIKDKLPDKLWIRNNISTITTNCLENFLFAIGAFIGIYDIKTVLIIALTTCLAEVIISLCDTPFIYIAKKYKI